MNPVVIYVLLGTVALFSIATFIVVLSRKPKDHTQDFADLRKSNEDTKNAVGGLQQSFETTSAVTKEMITGQTSTVTSAIQGVTQSVSEQFNGFRAENTNQMQAMQHSVGEQVAAIRSDSSRAIETVLQVSQTIHAENAQNTKMLTDAVHQDMQLMREDMQENLNDIRHTVDEQLQTNLEKKLQESFRTVSDQLMAVQNGLGQMNALASDVGDLRKTLSSVKTRGIWGEVQLGAIISEIMTPDQYETNVATVPRSTERVEFAIKLPGTDDGHVWLPIDSKFPGDTYNKLIDAYDGGDPIAVEAAWKSLEITLCNEAKDIHTKYVRVPDTTDFAIMFLPVEGLYAEACKHGLIEKLQQKYRITVAGPTTMSVLLNSLQMGFRTLQIQKQSSEVWKILQNTKSEFEKYGAVLTKVQERLKQTEDELETLVGVRTRVLTSKLSKIEQYTPGELPALPE
ncbi:MAG: DNA recombination protein RmuC [Bacteroidaceae bacterium]|nr:DNA recombination protein RmuC [Bacteroidaceae bacterium]